MADVFVSYKSEERELILRIVQRLEALGLTVWYDAQIQVGGHFDTQIEERLRAAKAVIVCWSQRSTKSDWVKREAAIADFHETIVPVFLDDAPAPDIYARREGARLAGWDGSSPSTEWTLVIDSLQRLLGRFDLLAADAALVKNLSSRPVADFMPRRVARTRRRLLALDAAGPRVMLQLKFLQQMEQIYEQQFPSSERCVLADYFDLIGGTSLGALVAALLAIGHRVEDVERTILALLPRWYPGAPFSGGLALSKFDAKKADADLSGLFGRMAILDGQMQTGLALCFKNVERNRPWVVTNNPSAEYNDVMNPQNHANSQLFVKDVLLACIGRPGQPVPIYSYALGESVDGLFGGLGNPAFELFQTVISEEHGLRWPLGPDKMLVISIGGGRWGQNHQRYPAKGEVRDVVAQSLAFDTIFAVDRVMRLLGQEPGRERPAKEVMPMFEYRRFDCALDAHALSKLLGRTVSETEAQSVQGYTRSLSSNASRLLDEIGFRAAEGMTASDFPSLFETRYELKVPA